MTFFFVLQSVKCSVGRSFFYKMCFHYQILDVLLQPDNMEAVVCNRSLTESLDFSPDSLVGVDELQNTLCATNITALSQQLVDFLNISAVIEQVVKIFTARERSARRLCLHRHLSVHRGGGGVCLLMGVLPYEGICI